MDAINIENVFNRSGLAAISDLNTQGYKDIFLKLEKEQDLFLRKEHNFRSKEYKWPRDPLHWWSRVWEYPYVYYHLAHYVEGFKRDTRPTVADIGSGVTFFPFSLAQLGYEVICTDIDPICERDLSRAVNSVSHSPGTVGFRLIDQTTLPFEDEECDALYCISVLEHMHNFENTIKEMARVLKPGGLCLVTCDLSLDSDGNTQLNVTQYNRLISLIEEEFCMFWSERTKHPVDVLTNKNGPYAERRQSYAQFTLQLTRQKILNPFLGKKPGHVNLEPAPLAVLGLALQKRK